MRFALGLACLASFVGAQAVRPPLDFDRDVRPLLAANCFQCHGPDGESREAGLRLDLSASAFAELPSGHRAIVPGDTDRSELVRRVRSADKDVQMPPPTSGRELSDAEREVLVRWVEEGARWSEHWAFRRPSRAWPPPAPESADATPLDRFILARLRSLGLGPSPEADRHTLARRVAFDLTGLPPTKEALLSFLNDDRPDAYERFVDTLLASPRYGEHMARFWLDAARYGDTHGLHLDNYREMWPYRDWVIEAFNRNLPYDRFLVEQLAGDLLPNATLAQQIASGFNRCHVTTNEGGSIAEEVYVRNVVDRTATAGTVVMGLSVGCAQCHDHKFDPISQRNFYELFAFFNNLDGDGMDGNAKDHAPVVRVPSLEDEQRIAAATSQRRALDEKLRAKASAVAYVEPETPVAAKGPLREVVWVDDAFPAGALAEGDGGDWVNDPVLCGVRALKTANAGRHQQYFRWADRKLRVAAGDVLFVWVWLDPTDPPEQIMVQYNAGGRGDGEWEHRAFFGKDLIPFGKAGTSGRRHLGPLPRVGQWVRLSIPVEDVGLQRSGVVHGMAFTQFGGTVHWDRAGVMTDQPQEPVDSVWIDDEAPSGARLQGDGTTWQWITANKGPVKSGSRALRRSGGLGLNQDFFNDAKPPLVVHAGDRLFAHAWLDPKNPPKGIQLQFHSGGWNHRVRLGDACHGPNAPGGGDYRAGDLPPLGEWIRIEVALKDVGLKDGDALDGWAFTQVGGTVIWDEAGVRTWSPPSGAHLTSQHAWELLAAGDAALPAAVREALAVAPDARTATMRSELLTHYVAHVYAPTRDVFEPLLAEGKRLDDAIAAAKAAVPTTLVMKERKEPRPAFLLERGEYDKHGAAVTRQTPEALPEMNPAWPKNRLGFARWATAPGHPLTARVAVNRFWQQVFGVGLVKTSEDFGVQGERPTHPELLDYLATTFIEDGFDVKRFMRTLVLSKTYRQSSSVTKALLDIDPENRFYARGPRFRLDAEMLRDQALALSGLLVEKIGGPGVKPPQPDGIWYTVAYRGSNTMRFVADKEAERIHRRTLYTFLKRTAPPPQMSTFDAPSREECRVRRERTNTPLQALLLLNDPQYMEAAKALGLRLVAREGDASERARFGLELVTGRPADPRDVADVVAYFEEERAHFRGREGEARTLLTVGDSPPPASLDVIEGAAWTLVANLLLNLDEVVTKG